MSEHGEEPEKGLWDRIKALGAGLAGQITSALQSIIGHFTEVKAQIRSLQTDSSNIKENINSLKTSLSAQGTDVRTILERMAAMETKLTSLGDKIDTLRTDMHRRFEDSVVRSGEQFHSLNGQLSELREEIREGRREHTALLSRFLDRFEPR